jgi:hypothetical protein
MRETQQHTNYQRTHMNNTSNTTTTTLPAPLAPASAHPLSFTAKILRSESYGAVLLGSARSRNGEP